MHTIFTYIIKSTNCLEPLLTVIHDYATTTPLPNLHGGMTNQISSFDQSLFRSQPGLSYQATSYNITKQLLMHAIFTYIIKSSISPELLLTIIHHY